MPLIDFEQAMERALCGVTRLGLERIPIEQAVGRVLAEDLRSPGPIPAFAYSAMDGYAVRSRALTGPGPWELGVRGESRAGAPGPALESGTACRISTGAPVPDGTDAVLAQEQVTRTGDLITVAAASRPEVGQHIRPRGADLEPGAVAIAAGTRLTPGLVGLAASLDRTHVLVGRRPVVTIASTGDELRLPGRPGPAGSVPESNSYVLAAIARRAGALTRTAPFVADDIAATRQALESALGGTDLLVTVGGVSVGDHDLVRPALAALGVRIEFWGVAIKPGKPTAFASWQGSRILCLPGNPASAALTFLLFGVTLLRAMQGQSQPHPRAFPLRVVGAHRNRSRRQEYLRAQLEVREGELCAVLPASQASGAVTSFAAADALVVLAADRPDIAPGDRLPVLLLAELW